MKTVSFTRFLIPEKLNSVIKSKSISLFVVFVNIFQRKQTRVKLENGNQL